MVLYAIGLVIRGQWSGVRGAFDGCVIWDATASAGHHPAFGHQPLRGRLTRLAIEAVGVLWAIADRSFASLRMTGREALETIGMLGLVLIVPLTRHSIPPYWAAPSPRGDSRRDRGNSATTASMLAASTTNRVLITNH